MSSTKQQLPPTLICPTCHGSNPPAAHLCSHCLAPLDSFAATDPLASVYAEVDTLAKAFRSPKYIITIIGMWMFLAPWVLIGSIATACIAIEGLAHADGHQSLGYFFGWLIGLAIISGLTIVCGTLLYRTTRNYVRYRQAARQAMREAPADDPDGRVLL